MAIRRYCGRGGLARRLRFGAGARRRILRAALPRRAARRGRTERFSRIPYEKRARATMRDSGTVEDTHGGDLQHKISSRYALLY